MLARTQVARSETNLPPFPQHLSALSYTLLFFSLDFVGALSDSVVDHSIMSRLDSALDSCVRLEVKIKVVPGIRW